MNDNQSAVTVLIPLVTGLCLKEADSKSEVVPETALTQNRWREGAMVHERRQK